MTKGKKARNSLVQFYDRAKARRIIADFTRKDVIFRLLVSTSFQSFSPRFVEIKFNYYSMTSVRWTLWKFNAYYFLSRPTFHSFQMFRENLTYLSLLFFFYSIIYHCCAPFNQITNSKIGMRFNYCK